MPDFYVNRRNGAPAHEGCNGVDVKDRLGRITGRYFPDRNGRIKVDNPDHAKAIEASAKADGGYIQKATGMTVDRTPSKHCKPCRFLAYKWQTKCPKCGAELSEGDPTP